MPDAPLALPPGTHYRDGWLWPIADVRGWPVIREEAARFGEILAHVPTDRRRVAVQAGGNCGLMVRPIADAFEQVITFEPDTTNFQCLRENFRDVDRVQSVKACLGDVGASVGMMGDPENCGVRRPRTALEERTGVPGHVPMIRLDAFLDVWQVRDVDFLMLDVEGYELHALFGAAETIARCKPVIVVELIGQAAVYGISDEEIVGWLGERGYVCKAQVMRDCVFVWEPD